MEVRPHNCVVGRTYLLKTKKGWEEVIALGHLDEYNMEFLFKNRGFFGTRLFAPKVKLHIGAESLRTKEKEVKKIPM